MHSSRMRTGRSLAVFRGGTWSGGVNLVQGVYQVRGVYLVWGVYLVPGGVPGPGGCTWSWGGYLPGTPPRGPGTSPPGTRPGTPPLLTESQTPVKTLPWPNFVAAGKDDLAHCATVRYDAHRNYSLKVVFIVTELFQHWCQSNLFIVVRCLLQAGPSVMIDPSRLPVFRNCFLEQY